MPNLIEQQEIVPTALNPLSIPSSIFTFNLTLLLWHGLSLLILFARSLGENGCHLRFLMCIFYTSYSLSIAFIFIFSINQCRNYKQNFLRANSKFYAFVMNAYETTSNEFIHLNIDSIFTLPLFFCNLHTYLNLLDGLIYIDIYGISS